MVFTIIYAVLQEKLHLKRVRLKQKVRLEDSVALSQISTHRAPSTSGGSQSKVSPDTVKDEPSANDDSNLLRAGEEIAKRAKLDKQQAKFEELMAAAHEDAVDELSMMRKWDLNFIEQEMEDLFRKMQGEGTLNRGSQVFLLSLFSSHVVLFSPFSSHPPPLPQKTCS